MYRIAQNIGELVFYYIVADKTLADSGLVTLHRIVKNEKFENRSDVCFIRVFQ